jgi:type I restriction enzyme S subunit
MAAEWCEHSFAELIQTKALEIGDGYRAKNSELGGEGPIFLRAGHVRDTHIDLEGVERFQSHLANAVASKMCQLGDVIVTTKGNSTGRTSYVSEDLPSFVYSPHLSYWRCLDTEIIDPRFLRYWSQSQHFCDQLAGLSASTDMAPYLSLIDQKRLEIVLPSIDEQRAIGRILGALDDKIELNRRMNGTLEAMARALFKSSFFDLDPNRTLANVADLNPESWSRRDYPAEIRYVDLSNTKWGIIQAIDIYSHSNAPSRAQRVLRTGDTIVGTVRPGNGSFAMIGEAGLTGSTGFAVLRPKQQHYREFIYCTATSGVNIERLSHLADGAAYPGVRPEVVAATELPAFEEDAALDFSAVTKPIFDRMELARQESESLAKIRDALLPKLISGELRVKDAEKFVEEAA